MKSTNRRRAALEAYVEFKNFSNILGLYRFFKTLNPYLYVCMNGLNDCKALGAQHTELLIVNIYTCGASVELKLCIDKCYVRQVLHWGTFTQDTRFGLMEVNLGISVCFLSKINWTTITENMQVFPGCQFPRIQSFPTCSA